MNWVKWLARCYEAGFFLEVYPVGDEYECRVGASYYDVPYYLLEFTGSVQDIESQLRLLVEFPEVDSWLDIQRAKR